MSSKHQTRISPDRLAITTASEPISALRTLRTGGFSFEMTWTGRQGLDLPRRQSPVPERVEIVLEEQSPAG